MALKQPTQRAKGEALTIFALSLGVSTAVKTGLSAVELIPLIGAAVGASSNAGILYSFRHSRF